MTTALTPEHILGIGRPYVTVGAWLGQTTRPGDQVCRDALRKLGTGSEVASVTEGYVNEYSGVWYVEPHVAGVEVQRVLDTLADIGATQGAVGGDAADVPDWMISLVGGAQEAEDDVSDAARGIKDFLEWVGRVLPHVALGVAVSLVTIGVVRSMGKKGATK